MTEKYMLVDHILGGKEPSLFADKLPWRERFLQEIANSETMDEVIRKNALTYLERLSEPQP